MKVLSARPWAVLFLTAAGVAATAQTLPSDAEAPQEVPGLVLSDAQPLPAEDRESAGAVVLHESRVRAHRSAFSASSERTGIPSAIGRNVSRVLDRARNGPDAVREADATRYPSQ
jgi:hypothetical protein